MNLVQTNTAGYGTFNDGGVDVDFALFDIFMITTNSSITFLFGDRKALVSVDSNCSRHMTRFYDRVDTKPCDVQTNGSFQQVFRFC